MSKTRIIACANHKGGVGKTATVANLGSILSTRAYKKATASMNLFVELLTTFLSLRSMITCTLCQHP